MPTLNFGIISTANIAKKALIPAIKRAHNAEVLAIASRGPQVHEVAQNYKIPRAYESYEELLADPDIQAVYIPLPNHLHKEWVIKAAQHGKHVLYEKPAALNAQETEEMLNIAKQHNVTTMEAFMYQFHAQHDRVREIIASGEIGDVKLMRAAFSFHMSNPGENIRLDAAKGGGSLYDVGCYCIHAARNILQAEPTEVTVQANIHPTNNVDMSAYGMMRMSNGVQVMFDSSFESGLRQEYEIIGNKGSIRVPRAYRPDAYGHDGIVIVTTGNVTREETITSDQYKNQVEHFANSVLTQTQPSYTDENTIQNMRVIDAFYESIKQGKAIQLG
ncbi:gfo/Idh/MocA family oxidoreductase [Bacillus sp. HMF5848]|uniref:Gfo/Idh/MocA family protein n=1 Tax=Bacillus sp. HMF5848 TaxID=2495421 RepID=UPI000F7A915B|nr:Gfo/Idh/MocA family oxidoreductase [Bacillus sp. HMF5848]RSK26431.1 gfo/Idh/MocA family oxidoreductase [Bacillus sp. HMF5848]